MRLLLPSIVLLSFSATIPVLSQSTPPAATPSTATTAKAPVDLTGFKEHIEEKNKALSSQVNNTKAIVKKNTAILEDAKKISADNLRLQAERKALDAQNAEFARESQAMQSETTGVTVPTRPPAPVRVEPVAPVRVEPPPPARVDTAVAPKVEAPQPVRVETVSAPRVETASAPRVEPIAPARVVPAAAPAAVAVPVAAVPFAVVTTPTTPAEVVVRTPDPTVNVAAGGGAPLARTPDAATPRATVQAPAEPLRISSGVSQGMLLTPIAPIYPPIAVTAHVEGAVVMEAVIGKNGSVSSVHAVSGPAMLRGAAMDAVKVARYRPYSVNGQLTEVSATIKVVFQLAH
jgi:protein TonB